MTGWMPLEAGKGLVGSAVVTDGVALPCCSVAGPGVGKALAAGTAGG